MPAIMTPVTGSGDLTSTTTAVLAVLVWLRHRLPTVRMDRWAEISWVVLVPLTIVQALVVALVVLARGGM